MLQETVYTVPECPQRFTLALAADVHGRSCRRILRSLRERNPQMICIAGDLIHGDADPSLPCKLEAFPEAVSFLKDCARIAPTYYSLGNHEWYLSEEDFSLISRLGVHLLHNRWERFSRSVLIGGLSSARVSSVTEAGLTVRSPNAYPAKWKRYLPGGQKRAPVLLPDSGWLEDFSRQEGFKILLCHHPEYWAEQEPFLRDRPFDLVLSGHAHGGQIRFYDPFSHEWSGTYAPEQGFFPKWTAGVHEGACGRMILSRGLANTGWPVPRLFNRKELVYVELGEPQAQTNQQNK